MTKFDNNKKCKKVQCFVGRDAHKEIFSISIFENLERHEFEGHMLLVPIEYDKILKSKYGDYMKLPPKESRKTRQNLDEFSIRN